MASSTVIYDACVLYPSALRDFLIQLAMTDLFKARWTDLIHDEWIRNLLKNRPDLTSDRLHKTRKLMNSTVSGCLVDGYENLIKSVKLPDENDRHVLAAAIHSDADIIVTFNLKDFPTEVLREYKIRALHPDDFILGLFDLDSLVVCRAAQQHRERLKNPKKSVNEYLLTLSSQGLIKTVQYLNDNIGLI
ncbi:MAG: PIN domain-containing protein [Chthoniobacterales bacterium]